MAEEISPLENHGWWMEQLRKDAKANRLEALRLADELTAQVEIGGGDLTELEKAAAELRRLYELNIDKTEIIAALSALNQELLEALKSTHALLQAALFIVNDTEARAIARQQLDVNRAAIAKAEGEKT
jgi:hypothetical protein